MEKNKATMNYDKRKKHQMKFDICLFLVNFVSFK